MKLIKYTIATLGLSLGLMVFNAYLPASLPAQPARADVASDKYDGDCTGLETAGRCADKQPFDHSLCQYPARTTNPPDGCDNTDPCDPANTKGGSGDCSDAAPAPAVIAAPAECEGK